jgi:hypothetical protein
MLPLPSIPCSVMDVCQAQKDHFSRLVNSSTIAVAVGVTFEGVELVHDLVASVKRWRRKRKESADLKELSEFFPLNRASVKANSMGSDHHPKWVKVIGRVGLILVVLGVVGESRYGAKLEDVQNDIHASDMARLTEAQQQAGDAKKSAEGAAKSASEAKDSAKQADKDAGIALDKSNRANAAASTALSEAVELRTSVKAAENELNEEHNKRIELEKSLTPRSAFAIRVEKGKAQLPDLTGFQDMKFDLVLIHDAEAVRAAGAIVVLLKAAGWIRGTTTFVEYGTPETPEDGVSVSWFLAPRRYDTSIPETEEIVRSWMRCEAAGLGLIVFLEDHEWEVHESMDLDHNVQNTIRIKIGFKPNPYFSPFKELEKKINPRERNFDRERMQSAQRELREQGEHPWLFPHQESPH